MPPAYRSPIFDHPGLGAAMFGALGMGEGLDRATRHQPETRIVTPGDAVKAMVLNGLGCVNQQRYLGPRLFQDTPLSRLLVPWLIEAHLRTDDALGRALDTLYAYDVTARLSGQSRDVQQCGQVVREHIAPWPITHGPTDLVAESALSRAANLQQFANTQRQWKTRVPATLSDAQAVLRQADPPPMTPLADG